MKLLSWLYVPLLAGVVLAADVPSPDMPTDQFPTDQFPTDQFPTDQLPWNFPTDQKPTDVTGVWQGKYASINADDRGLIGLLIEARDGWLFKGRLIIGDVTLSIEGLVDADGRCAIIGADALQPDNSGIIFCKSPKADPPNPDRVLIVGTIRDGGRNGIWFEGNYVAISGDRIVDLGELQLVNNE